MVPRLSTQTIVVARWESGPRIEPEFSVAPRVRLVPKIGSEFPEGRTRLVAHADQAMVFHQVASEVGLSLPERYHDGARVDGDPAVCRTAEAEAALRRAPKPPEPARDAVRAVRLGKQTVMDGSAPDASPDRLGATQVRR